MSDSSSSNSSKKSKLSSPETVPCTKEDLDNLRPASAEKLTHFNKFLKDFQTQLDTLVRNDPILEDLEEGLDLVSAKNQLAFETGQAIRLNILRDDSSILPVIVRKTDTVLDLRNGVERETQKELERGRRQAEREGQQIPILPNISWRYIWRTYYLAFQNKPLTDHRVFLKDLGIQNKSNLTFVKKFREKGTSRRYLLSRKRQRSPPRQGQIAGDSESENSQE